ncbi:glycosyltransferase family 15 protein [Thelephora ganbajun]|uniref:Glycosyltransferase family 15 protein n=1 Tax=Thelephora ganbajun TaxID=370292 RepID=A0ACB6ZME7_THEGA|nr:glycosyltransferase family 15 protein [Thelephora ganbajun]
MSRQSIPFGLPSRITMTPIRYVILVVFILISLYSILSLSNESYGQKTSMSNLFNSSNEEKGTEALVDDVKSFNPQLGKANAVFLMLCRNEEVDGAVKSIRELEDRFNHEYHYPWVFLNEVEFTDDFKKRVGMVTYSKVEFGVIPHEHWYQPDWIDEDKASKTRKQMEENNIIYGGSLSYRNMCRFNSGFFYRHDLLQKYRYYWRVEPDVQYFCNIQYDPFVYMEEHNKTYSFTLTMLEYVQTIPTFWNTMTDFIKKNPQYVAENNAMDFLSTDGGRSYSLCHFWSNFEIADMNLWRGEAYTKYFDHLDTSGGFYYERWGDAVIHSVAAGLFQSKDQIHFFKDIGYQHDYFAHCPEGASWSTGKCSCNPKDNFDFTRFSCLGKWLSVNS